MPEVLKREGRSEEYWRSGSSYVEWCFEKEDGAVIWYNGRARAWRMRTPADPNRWYSIQVYVRSPDVTQPPAGDSETVSWWFWDGATAVRAARLRLRLTKP